ncbi:hypothetical protein HYH02_011188 [Chlamydomonas schloesseri]|uniref:Uncharacterized protein n=1 Tax=Chlamydomonas schloesseri TaxID=2026947 RepID=A0A835W6L2_9CHLO|nr:hypothetical protein HYH02_011188 [Chlamydomonas schloesseri]|eukprot:KAG2437546.1 hypothetical protein HYH02_011188 [Chlamydomonas schloesseri]
MAAAAATTTSVAGSTLSSSCAVNSDRRTCSGASAAASCRAAAAAAALIAMPTSCWAAAPTAPGPQLLPRHRTPAASAACGRLLLPRMHGGQHGQRSRFALAAISPGDAASTNTSSSASSSSTSSTSKSATARSVAAGPSGDAPSPSRRTPLARLYIDVGVEWADNRVPDVTDLLRLCLDSGKALPLLVQTPPPAAHQNPESAAHGEPMAAAGAATAAVSPVRVRMEQRAAARRRAKVPTTSAAAPPAAGNIATASSRIAEAARAALARCDEPELRAALKQTLNCRPLNYCGAGGKGLEERVLVGSKLRKLLAPFVPKHADSPAQYTIAALDTLSEQQLRAVAQSPGLDWFLQMRDTELHGLTGRADEAWGLAEWQRAAAALRRCGHGRLAALLQGCAQDQAEGGDREEDEEEEGAEDEDQEAEGVEDEDEDEERAMGEEEGKEEGKEDSEKPCSGTDTDEEVEAGNDRKDKVAATQEGAAAGPAVNPRCVAELIASALRALPQPGQRAALRELLGASVRGWHKKRGAWLRAHLPGVRPASGAVSWEPADADSLTEEQLAAVLQAGFVDCFLRLKPLGLQQQLDEGRFSSCVRGAVAGALLGRGCTALSELVRALRLRSEDVGGLAGLDRVLADSGIPLSVAGATAYPGLDERASAAPTYDKSLVYMWVWELPGGGQFAAYCGKQSVGRKYYTTRVIGYYEEGGPGLGELVKHVAVVHAVSHGVKMETRVMPGHGRQDELELAVLRALDFPLQRKDNGDYRLGPEFWRKVGLPPVSLDAIRMQAPRITQRLRELQQSTQQAAASSRLARLLKRSRAWHLSCFLAASTAACAAWWREASTATSTYCPAYAAGLQSSAGAYLPWLLAAAGAWLLTWELLFRVSEERVCALPGGVGYILERRYGCSCILALPLLLPQPSRVVEAAAATAALSAGVQSVKAAGGVRSGRRGGPAPRWAWRWVPLHLGLARRWRQRRFLDGRDVLYVTLSEAISSVDVRYFLAFALRDAAGGGGAGGAGGCLAVPFEALLPHLRLRHLTPLYRALLGHQHQHQRQDERTKQ